MLAPLQKVNDGAVVGIVPHREENVMTIAIALDDDLIGAAPQHRAAPPTLAPVDHIAETQCKLAQINLPFEVLELAIPIDH